MKIENNDLKFLKTADGLNNDVVYSIAADKSGRVWLSTASNGLNYLQNDSVFTLNENNGLSGNIFTALSTDSKGNVLAIGDNGFDIICSKTRSVINYGKEWGLDANNVDLNSVFVFNDVFYIGTEKGILIYNALLEPKDFNTQTIIESIKSPQRDIASDNSKKLAYDENNLTFTISHNNLVNAGNISFQYFL
ncbi:MAG: hypothetical protein IPJ79_04230 [Bacteroidetes bacterium]|nr:hypothetical protein [Bacteroidota bacterium]